MSQGNLGDFLQVFKNLLSHEVSLREDIIESITKHIGIEIDKTQLQIKNGTGILTCHPVIKNEILLKKKEIMESLKDVTKKKISDIR